MSFQEKGTSEDELDNLVRKLDQIGPGGEINGAVRASVEALKLHGEIVAKASKREIDALNKIEKSSERLEILTLALIVCSAALIYFAILRPA